MKINKLLMILVTTALISGCGQKGNNGSINCEHAYEEEIITPATIVNKGTKKVKCTKCGNQEEKEYYDLDEFVFEDKTFMYDGKERQLTIDGMIPYGTTVEYENNKLTEKGSKEATAKIYDQDHKLLMEKKATLKIVDNVGLPNIRITTSTGQDPDWKEREEYTTMTLTVDNCKDEYKMENIRGGLRVRGNSTNQEQVAKRAWRIKFDAKQNMLGLNGGTKEKSWVLLADFFDESMFRNASAFTMGNALFNYNGNYCSSFQHVNFYMNGDDRGVYLLAEQQQCKKDRVPVKESEGDKSTSVGYLVEIDGLVTTGQTDEEYYFTSKSLGRLGNMNVGSKGYVIKTDVFSQDQATFIENYINNCLTLFYNAVSGGKKQTIDKNGNVIDSPYKTVYETLNSFMDVDSFFRMYLLQEMVKNYDVGWGSFYLFVDFTPNAKTTRLTMGAPWDFDLSTGNKTSGGAGGWGGGWGGQPGGQPGGNTNTNSDIPTSGISSTKDNFLNNSEYANGMTTFNPWLYMLSQSDFFNTMIKQYYRVFANSGVYQKVVDLITYESSAFADAFNRTYTLFGYPNASGSDLMQTRTYSKHQDAVNYLLKWYDERHTYLDSVYLK